MHCVATRCGPELCECPTIADFCVRAINTAEAAAETLRHVILDCQMVNGTDTTGCEAENPFGVGEPQGQSRDKPNKR